MFQVKCESLSRLLPVLALSLGLLACASPANQSLRGAGDEGASTPVEGLLADRFIVDACTGRATGYLNFFRYSTDRICDSLFDGLVGGFAAIGGNRPASRFCVTPGFDVDGYKAKFLRAMQDDSLSSEKRLELVLSDVRQVDSAEGACGWEERQTIGPLGESCSWFDFIEASDPLTHAEKRLAEAGIFSDRERKEIVGGAMAHCMGYLLGFFAADLFAVELAEEQGICDGEQQTIWASDTTGLATMALDLSKVTKRQPKRSAEPAGRYLYGLYASGARCRPIDDGGSAQTAPVGSPADREAAQRRTQHWLDLGAKACRADGELEDSRYKHLAADAYCEMYLAGIIEGYASIEGAKQRSVACLRGGPDLENLRAGLKPKLSNGVPAGLLATTLRREIWHHRGLDDDCLWQGRGFARSVSVRCLGLVAQGDVSYDDALDVGRSLEQDFANPGRDLDQADRQDFSACMAFMWGVILIVSDLPPAKGKAAVCVPDLQDGPGTALLMALDLKDEASRRPSASDATFASVVHESASKWASCEPSAVN